MDLSLLFADNTANSTCDIDHQSLKSNLELSLRKMLHWFHCNKLVVNTSKTLFMFFSRTSTAVPALQEVEVTFGGRVIKINRVQTTRYLGVIVDQNLSWKAHITSLRLKLGRNVGVMHRLKFFLPFYALKSIYFSLVHSYINYCSIIYLSTFQSHISPIVKLQNKAMRILKMLFYSPVSLPGKSPTKSLYSYFNIIPVRQILAFQCILFRVRYLKDLQPDCFKSFFPGPPSVRPYNTRCPLSKLPVPFIVSERSRFSPKNVITNYWNTYESFFDQSLSLLTLKTKIKALLISKY